MALSGYLLAVVEVLLPLRRFMRGTSSFTMGLVVEGGYGFSTDLTFHLAPEPDGELRQIPLQGSRIGALSPSGAQVRFGFVARF